MMLEEREYIRLPYEAVAMMMQKLAELDELVKSLRIEREAAIAQRDRYKKMIHEHIIEASMEDPQGSRYSVSKREVGTGRI